jgi:ABC-type glycerol-3-phosphate transport system permease component
MRGVRGSPPPAIRNAGAWLVLILLSVAAVVQMAANPTRFAGRNGALAMLHAVVAEGVHVLVGFGLALLLHHLAPRAALWIAIGVAAIATYGAANHLNVHGGFTAAHVWTGIPFGLLFAAAALDAIPRAVREAAMIDRASGWFSFRTITLPLAAPLLAGGAIFLAAAAMTRATLWPFVAAHALLIAAIGLDAALARGRR